jgi:ribosomal protein S13
MDIGCYRGIRRTGLPLRDKELRTTLEQEENCCKQEKSN